MDPQGLSETGIPVLRQKPRALGGDAGWEDAERSSVLKVRSRAAGDIALIVERRGPRLWYPSAIGWLGIDLWRGDGHTSRPQAKQTAVEWLNENLDVRIQ